MHSLASFLAPWLELATALTLFYLSHILPSRPKWRAALTSRIGRRAYGAGYGVLSLLLLAWLITAAAKAPYIGLWDQLPWHRWAINILMPVAILLATFAIAAPNPLSFGGRKTGYDPDHPGIVGVCRHPLLLALALWAGLHLMANGDLAHALVFAPFALYPILAMGLVDRRNQGQWGQAEWQRLAARTSLLPLSALVGGRWQPQALPSLIRLGIAILLWAAILQLHAPLIGVSPLP